MQVGKFFGAWSFKDIPQHQNMLELHDFFYQNDFD
jgi:hypothetical protein